MQSKSLDGNINKPPLPPYSKPQMLPALPPNLMNKVKKLKGRKQPSKPQGPPSPDMMQRIPLNKVMSRRQALLSSGLHIICR